MNMKPRMESGIFRILSVVGLFCAIAGAAANNHYGAPGTLRPPVIDGTADTVWDKAPWDSIPYAYIGTAPTQADFAGRYKAMWDSGHVYLLVEIVDDSVSDTHAEPLDNYWNDDALELFVDENHDGGVHQYNFKAWAYHISTRVDASGNHDVVDAGTDQQNHLFNNHFKVVRKQVGHTSLWELSMLVNGDNYTLAGPNTPLVLHDGKVMGFTVAYCDNDGGTTRENFMGSVNTPGHFQNQGYIDASCFGTLELQPAGTPTSIRGAVSPGANLEIRPDGFRFTSGYARRVEVRRVDGTKVDSFLGFPGTWYGADLPAGSYSIALDGKSRSFRKLR